MHSAAVQLRVNNASSIVVVLTQRLNYRRRLLEGIDRRHRRADQRRERDDELLKVVLRRFAKSEPQSVFNNLN